MRTRAVVKGRHTRKTGAFVRVCQTTPTTTPINYVSTQACIAYSFITIPSVDNSLHQLHLFLVSGKVAVANGALSQGE